MLARGCSLPSYSCMQCLPSFAPSQPTPCRQAKSYRRTESGSSRKKSLVNGRHCRGFTTTRPSRASEETVDLQWPDAPPGKQVPGPYDIFKQKKGSPYSKRRFYELVKIYHPDRDPHNEERPGNISAAVRLERYRLIVEANDILSDPAKRDAYDRWGAGWDERPGVSPWAYQDQEGHPWRNGHRSTASNATWEDWERWRHHEATRRDPQAPLYFSNGSFVVLIVLFAIVGGAAELSRAKHMSKTFLQQIEEKHDRTSKELRSRMRESQAMSSHEQRVQSFLSMRNPGSYGVGGHRGDEYNGKALPPPSTRSSERHQSRSSRDLD